MTLLALTDIESTGFLEPEHRIIEAYIDLVEWETGRVVYSYLKRINPKRSIAPDAQRVHGIAGSDLLHCPDWETVGPDVAKVLSKAQVFVAHNAAFDFGFYNQEFKRVGLPELTMPVLCTMEGSIWAAPTGKKPSLRELCFAMGIDYDPALAHAAAYDVERMRLCLMRGREWGWYQNPLTSAHAEAA